MAKHSVRDLDEGQLEMMWNFLRMGCQYKPNVPALKEHLEAIRQAMIQKTGGNRETDPAYYTDHDDVGTHINCVVVETMCLYLSGELDKLFAEVKPETGWISVNDRLPEKDSPYSYSGDVIVTDGTRTSIGYYSYSNENWFDYYGDIPTYAVSHWLPIPRLPEEVSEDDEP